MPSMLVQCTELAEKLAADLQGEGLKGKTLTLKLKATTFEVGCLGLVLCCVANATLANACPYDWCASHSPDLCYPFMLALSVSHPNSAAYGRCARGRQRCRSTSAPQTRS